LGCGAKTTRPGYDTERHILDHCPKRHNPEVMANSIYADALEINADLLAVLPTRRSRYVRDLHCGLEQGDPFKDYSAQAQHRCY
jgi:hypothetical protein